MASEAYSYYVLEGGPLSGTLRRITVEPVKLSEEALAFLSRCVDKHWTSYSVFFGEAEEELSPEERARAERETAILEELARATLAEREGDTDPRGGYTYWSILLPRREGGY